MTIEGVKIHYTEDALANNAEMVDWMTESLTEIERLVPSEAWNVMKTTEVYVNDKYFLDGKPKTGACNHWSEGWLTANGDMAEKESHIEIYNIGDILNWSKDMPSVMLHEMAHAFHWRQGNVGSELSPITKETYSKAMSDGKYDCVKHWNS